MTAWGKEATKNLRSILANLYPMIGDGRRLAKDAGLSEAQIEFSNKAINNWFSILERAKHEYKIDSIVALAIDENPENEALLRARDQAPPPTLEGPAPSSWHGADSLPQLEKLMGTRSTLVSINYLELGLTRARSVGRVKRHDGSSGTGFTIGDNILLTNHHVLPDAETARTSVVQYNYQKTVAGLDAQVEEYTLQPEDFFKTSDADDWTAVRIAGNPVTKWGTLALTGKKPMIGEHVNIIQHPGGQHKQMSFFANVIVFAGESRIQYLTDTLPGSSGAPVFDVDWNVIALHHSGGWLVEPNASSKTTYYRNEGIVIDKITEALALS
ncbi:MAG: trypsin-like peptidase domain-containing protein [Phyllobacterium sp.]|uniref:trypsin-like peptidase domain-containing protein n=1 Tax=Phyllobacterium sp. TaxID=1871046 RepID=UPI0030F23DD1